MDLLFKRYASPFLLLNTMIDSERFSDFVSKLFEFYNEEISWEYYLHKVFDKSFKEFMKPQGNNSTKPQEKISQSELEATINQSKNIAKRLKKSPQ